MTIPDAIQLTSQGREKLANSAPDRSSFDADLPDKQIKKIAAKLGIPVIALMDHLSVEDYKERDPHWNERGHRRVANVIAQVWRNNALRPGLAPTNEPWATTELVASKVPTSL
jgi:hypothetical protein